jgi:hypothetical protein
MTSGHLIFIPAVLALGFLLGFLFSRQWAQDQINRALKREKERAEARERRAARKGKGKGESSAKAKEETESESEEPVAAKAGEGSS